MSESSLPHYSENENANGAKCNERVSYAVDAGLIAQFNGQLPITVLKFFLYEKEAHQF